MIDALCSLMDGVGVVTKKDLKKESRSVQRRPCDGHGDNTYLTVMVRVYYRRRICRIPELTQKPKVPTSNHASIA